MKKDKGFTLIELLAVITLIGILSIIGSISVTKLITSSKEKTYEQQVYNIEKAAKTWATNNTSFLNEDEGFKTYITVEDLKLAGLLEKVKIIDPRTEKELDGCVQITYNTKNKKYKYQYTNTCNDKSNYPIIEITYNENKNNYIEVSQDKSDIKNEIINNILVNAIDENGNVINVSEPIIFKNGKEVDSINPNKIGDIYVLTFAAKYNNLTTTKSLKLKVVDTTPPRIFNNDNDITNYIIQENLFVNKDSFNDPILTVEDNSGEKIEIVRSGKVNTGKIGEYRLEYTATDSSKNKSTYKINVSVKKQDELSFALQLSPVDGDNGWYKSSPKVSIVDLTFGDKDKIQTSDSVTCKYKINNFEWIDLGVKRDFVIEKEGNNLNLIVECSYKDTYNNEYTESQKTIIKIDKTAPKCISSGGTGTDWTNNNVTIKGTCSDSLSGCVSNKRYIINVASGKSLSKSNVGPGSNGGTAIVYDKAGNNATCPANQNVNIDKIPPICSIKAINEDGSSHNNWVNQNVTINSSCSDQGGSGCKVSTKNTTYKVDTNSTKTHTYYDVAGNSSSCNIKVQIDKTPPSQPDLTGCKVGYGMSKCEISGSLGLFHVITYVNASPYKVYWQASSIDLTSGIKYWQYKYDGFDYWRDAGDNGITDRQYKGYSHYYIRACDQADNCSIMADFTICDKGSYLSGGC